MDSMFEYFKAYAQECGGNRFLFNEEKSLTVEKAYREMLSLSAALWKTDVRVGSMVALRCTRSIETCLIYFALQTIGAVAVLTDPHQSVKEFFAKHGISIPISHWITDEEGDWKLLNENCKVTLPFKDGDVALFFPVCSDCDGLSTIVFTSGSTGKSKAVCLSQTAILQYSIDVLPYGWYCVDDIAAVTLPLHHVFSLCLVVTSLMAHHALFFPRSARADYVLECIERYRITRMNGVPSYYYVLARANEISGRDVSSLRTGFIGGAPIIAEQFRFVEQSLGITLLSAYGMSECISIACTSPEDGLCLREMTVGKLHRGAGCIVDVEGKELPCGKEGEICLFGSAVMLGYYGEDSAFDEKGRFHTGDLGMIDENGYLHISGRKKDIIIRNGINLIPSKIEAAIRALSEVKDAAVIGVRHEMLGEAPCAMVVLQKGNKMTAETLKALLAAKIAKNEIPVTIVFADSIPLTGTGKPDKQKIKEMFWEWKA